jgi:uncharacterized protein (TIRG00374 family)
MKKITRLNKKSIRKISEILIFILAVVVLLPQARELFNNQEALKNVFSPWVFLAASIYILTMFLAAASFIYLSNKPLKILNTIAVQVANGFTNRILPSGSGAITTNSLYLKKSGHELPEALTLSLINNILGFTSFLIIMFLLGAFQKDLILNLLPKFSKSYLIIGTSIFLLFVFIGLKNKAIKTKIKNFYADFLSALSEVASRPLGALMSLLANCGITIIHVICLALCIIGTGNSLPTGMIALVFASTITAVSVSPTPNGLGVAELAMSLALQSFGINVAESLVIVISYRLVTYWLPIIPGYVTYRVLRYKNII